MPMRDGRDEQRVAGNAIDSRCVTVERQTVAGGHAACEVEQEGVGVLPEIRFARRQAHGDPLKKRRRRDRHQPGAQRSIQADALVSFNRYAEMQARRREDTKNARRRTINHCTAGCYTSVPVELLRNGASEADLLDAYPSEMQPRRREDTKNARRKTINHSADS